jgi:hypothetical protein
MLGGKLYCGSPVCDTVRFGLFLKSVQGSANLPIDSAVEDGIFCTET